ncbi:leucine-rich repeat receptor protein kinase MSP1-like [Oryza glaberrima]|uniref:Protein kinase domain-containing protein n=2 Tax=Oryza TaxID=4527 RepID=A0A0D3HIP6_9ORYZ|nr:leucine-rich repeat receptor protein kinase MSP1-like [Oryza glaberrima]
MDGVLQALVVAVAASAAILFPCLAIAFFCRHRHRHRVVVKPRCRCLQPLSSAATLPVTAPSSRSCERVSSWSFYGGGGDAGDRSLKMLSLDDLAGATGGFSPDNIIGDGSFGFVYRAVLPDGARVAVKRLSADHASGGEGNREFRAELEVLGTLSHPNLARLLGFCAAGADRLLVYELLERGSLDAWLYGDAAGAAGQLPWPARLRIARGVAAALAFLHHGNETAILHRDIKASNVLLDEGFEAKLADFGLARIAAGGAAESHLSTQAAGTAGYMAPELRAGVGASVKADVYSFGVLLMEMVTGRRPSWPVKINMKGKEVEMLKWARDKVDKGQALEILDRQMGIQWEGREADQDEMIAYLDVARRCTEESPKHRPSMEEVVEMLNKI